MKKLPKPNTKFQDYLKNPDEHSLFPSEVDHGEVCTLLTKLDISKSADISKISPKLLKCAAHILCFPLTKIFNKSFELGVFPNRCDCTYGHF